jgi:hypothetical protein
VWLSKQLQRLGKVPEPFSKATKSTENSEHGVGVRPPDRTASTYEAKHMRSQAGAKRYMR